MQDILIPHIWAVVEEYLIKEGVYIDVYFSSVVQEDYIFKVESAQLNIPYYDGLRFVQKFAAHLTHGGYTELSKGTGFLVSCGLVVIPLTMDDLALINNRLSSITRVHLQDMYRRSQPNPVVNN